jgi:hypothetical protein
VTAANAIRDPELAGELERLGRMRIFFAHRSVGADLMNGVRAIACENGGVPISVREVGRDLSSGVFGHAMLAAANGDPVSKLRHLERMLGDGIGEVADVVLFKFCYADFSAQSDPTWMFRSYDRTIRALRMGFPHLKFLHVTAPLTTARRSSGARAAVDAFRHRTPGGLVDNSRREEFNDLVRRTYDGREPVFDLARAESTTADGAHELHDLHGRPVANLVPAYTTDGGHLNELARAKIARQLVSTIASLADAG